MKILSRKAIELGRTLHNVSIVSICNNNFHYLFLQYIYKCIIVGITNVFSCINICRVLRQLFEHEAVRPSFQTSSEGPGKC